MEKKHNNNKNSNIYCLNKITEETIEIENLNQIECVNDNEIDDIPIYEKINYIKCIIQNKNSKRHC